MSKVLLPLKYHNEDGVITEADNARVVAAVWSVDTDLGHDEADDFGLLIVRAANSHEALLDALKIIAEGSAASDRNAQDTVDRLRQIARAAIQKAEAR